MDYERVLVTPVGRKADDYFRKRRPDDIPRVWSGYPAVEYNQAVEIAEHIAKRYVAGEVDEVVLVFNRFVSALTQTPRIAQVLPLGTEGAEEDPSDEEIPFDIEKEGW